MQPTPSPSGDRRLGRLYGDSRARRARLVERARSIQKRLPSRSLPAKVA